MLPRISRFAFAIAIAAGVFGADSAHAQLKLESPLQLTSLEWLVADSEVIVRGTVADVATDQSWNIVTLDVLESLKGGKAERLKFALQKFDKGDAALAESKKSKRESLWILKRQAAGAAGEAPNRERLLARHKIDLYAPFLPGRPGAPALPVIPLGDADLPPSLLTIDLRVLKTSDEIVAAIRTALAEPQGDQKSPRSYAVSLPAEIAEQTGFSRVNNLLVVPEDRRLEEFARRLVQTPGEFVAPQLPSRQTGPAAPSARHALRIEGVKALRLFPSERNFAIVRTWLDNPLSSEAFADMRTDRLIPALPKSQAAANVALPLDLAQVPEIQFQQPLTKAMNTADAQLHTAVTIDGVHLMNQKKTDAYIEALKNDRPDLAGLSFAMGKACRLLPEASRQFVAALDVFRKVEAQQPSSGKKEEPALVQQYREQSAEKKINPSASVAALMQVLGPEDAKTRLALANYLATLPQADATRALAKLAIFSAEPEIRTEAVAALQKRDPKDYTDVLIAGLSYPWPAVAERSSEAMVKLERKDLVANLIDALEKPDPRVPQTQEIDGKKVAVVRELVRVNHHHNCLLCHAPATATRDNSSKEDIAKLEGLTAQIPVPSESMVAYYRPSVPDILVRIDVTYLRQDFSLKLPVANADPWPELQRYDFLVRTREVTSQEAAAYRKLLEPARPESPYRRAVQSALRELTGRDAQPTAAAWRKSIGL
jgi:hypothetical protein